MQFLSWNLYYQVVSCVLFWFLVYSLHSIFHAWYANWACIFTYMKGRGGCLMCGKLIGKHYKLHQNKINSWVSIVMCIAVNPYWRQINCSHINVHKKGRSGYLMCGKPVGKYCKLHQNKINSWVSIVMCIAIKSLLKTTKLFTYQCT